jgi:CRP-like cAMP-binding protein
MHCLPGTGQMRLNFLRPAGEPELIRVGSVWRQTMELVSGGATGKYQLAMGTVRAYREAVSAGGRFSAHHPMPDSNIVSQNRLLEGLGQAEIDRLQPNLKRVRLTRGQILHPVRAPIAHIYFPEMGMVSMLTVMTSGEQIETAIIGNEGVVGGWVAFDGSDSNTQSTVQVEGSALQLPTAKYLESYNASSAFRDAINRYEGVIRFQAQQSAACHAIHTVEARFCRWLLISEDVLGSEHVPLTQEFLSHMLGVRRTSVSLVAHTLQKAGVIQYSRGKIKILDRKALEDCTCECYSVIREKIDSVVPFSYGTKAKSEAS